MSLTTENQTPIQPPNDLAEVAQPTVSTPNDLVEVAQPDVSVPSNLTEIAQPSVSTPNDLTGVNQPSVSVPNDLTEVAQPAVVAPTAITALEQQPIARPTPCVTLALNFAQENYQINGVRGALTDLITFSRATTSTYFGRDLDSFGNWVYSLKTAAIDEPCLAYDPSTLEPLGLQAFGAATNLLTYSEQFDNASWVKEGATAVADAATSPTGVFDADRVVESAVDNVHGATSSGVSITASTDYTLSMHLKSSGRTKGRVRVGTNAGFVLNSEFDLVAGTTSVGSVVKLMGDWYRIEVPFTTQAGASTMQQAGVYIYADNGDSSYLGDGTSGIYIWGAQLETGSIATPYIKTEASQVTRAADIATVDDLSGWYNQSQGSVFVDGRVGSHIQLLKYPRWLALNEQLEAWQSDSGGLTGAAAGFVGEFTPISMNPDGSSDKFLISYSPTNVLRSVNGGAVDVSALSGAVAATKLYIGGNQEGGIRAPNGYIKTLNYYPSQLTENEMKLITL